MSDGRFGRGDWWEIQPPPPGEDDEFIAGQDDEEIDLTDIPPNPEDEDWLEQLKWGGSVPREVWLANQLVDEIENVDLRNIRGIAFSTPEEAFNWLIEMGLVSISKIVQQGNSYYPVIGEYDDDDTTDDEGDVVDDDNSGVIIVSGGA